MTFASHTYAISSRTATILTRGYDAMMLLIIPPCFTWEHVKWDVAPVTQKAMKMLL